MNNAAPLNFENQIITAAWNGMPGQEIKKVSCFFVRFALFGFAGIRGRNISATLAKSSLAATEKEYL